MLTVAEALDAIKKSVCPGPSVAKPLSESLGDILAEDLTTPHDSPPFDKSMMDGFAVNSAGFGQAEKRQLPVLETITAGTLPQHAVDADSAVRIMTGAPIPVGADCVVPIEATGFSEDAPETVTIGSDVVAADRNVLRQGVSAKAGTPLMPVGTRIAPQHIAVLAEFGVAQVPVFKRPEVAVLATGDELLPIDQPLTPGRIRNSNEPMLAGQILRANAQPLPLGIARDCRDELRECITRGLKCDFLLLSGGVSAGTLDLVPSELAAAGVDQVFHKIQMKPGKPLWFGQLKTEKHACWVFGLPGNPVSSMICFELFVRTALEKFTGSTSQFPAEISATLTSEVCVRGNRTTYFPAHLQTTASGLKATPVPWGGSADLRSTAEANGMIVLQPQETPYSVGESVPSISW